MSNPSQLSPLAAPVKRQGRRSKVGYWIALFAFLGVAGTLIYNNLGTNLNYYITPTEFKTQELDYTDKTLRMGAQVKMGTVKYNKETFDLSFIATDGNMEYPVHYKGAIPDLFKEGLGVIVEGKVVNGTLEGTNLLVKHSEEYQAPKGVDLSPKGLTGG
jgi:cytochrome c-type biogenesis protein CcmE